MGGGGSGGGSGGLVKLLTVTRASTGALDTGASAIPTGHGTLYVSVLGRTAAAANTESFTLTFNGDTAAHYDNNGMQGSNSSTTAGAGNAAAANISASGLLVGNTATANEAGAVLIEIPFYDNATFFKSGVISMATPDGTAANIRMASVAFGWRSTSAINQITLDSASHFLTGSTMVVFGTQ